MITSNRPSPARLVGQHKISTEIPAALGAPPTEGDTEETLDERIGRLLKTPEDPESPSRLADISFGSAVADPFENCVLGAPTVLQPTASLPVASAPPVTVSTARDQPQLGPLQAGDLSVVLGMWPEGVEEAWRLLRAGLPLPPESSATYTRFVGDLRVARSTARVMAGVILSLPGFDDPKDQLPTCVVDWLCRFFR